MNLLTPLHARGAIIGCIIAISIAGLLAPKAHRPLILYNDSASVPLGFWVRATSRAPNIYGNVIAFTPPPPAIPYVRKHMPEYLTAALIIKYIVATAGDTICREQNGNFTVNGKILGQAASADSRGNPLPSWTGCKTLRPGEVAVFSNRIPNSFDSRYYGTIPPADQVAHYVPLWVW